MCDGDVTLSGRKRPKWNIDHPLNHPASELVGAYTIRTGLRIEAALGKFLEHDRCTVAFEPRLGANDIKGNTHLLRVDADESWWEALPRKLNKFVKLSNMWPSSPSPRGDRRRLQASAAASRQRPWQSRRRCCGVAE